MKLPAPPSSVETALDLVAVYRLTRLAQVDTVPPVLEIREAVLDRWGDRRWAEVLECRWCGGMWVAMAVAAARAAFPRAWPIVARILAGSAAAGLLAGLEE